MSEGYNANRLDGLHKTVITCMAILGLTIVLTVAAVFQHEKDAFAAGMQECKYAVAGSSSYVTSWMRECPSTATVQ